MNETKVARLKGLFTTVLVVVVIGLIIACGVYLQVYTTEVSTVMVENIFVDIDNDGDLDLLVSGEVVVNEPPFTETATDELTP